jgi:TRAP-type mannitol/chloroaromatic compound transport system permease large subunit
MYTGIWPFIALQLSVVALIMAFPGLVTWLPSVAQTGFK